MSLLRKNFAITSSSSFFSFYFTIDFPLSMDLGTNKDEDAERLGIAKCEPIIFFTSLLRCFWIYFTSSLIYSFFDISFYAF